MNKIWDVIAIFLLASIQLIEIYIDYGITVAGPISYIMVVVFIAAIVISGWIEGVDL